MRTDEVLFLDTNVLVYAVDERSPFNPKATRFIERINAGDFRVCLSPQVMGELYSTITNPRKSTKPCSPGEAVRIVRGFWEADNIQKVYPNEATLDLTLDLVQRYRIKAMNFFDAQIVATMLENGVRTIYTVNGEDFSKFEEIEAINPFVGEE